METGMSPAQYFLYKCKVDHLLAKKQREYLPGKWPSLIHTLFAKMSTEATVAFSLAVFLVYMITSSGHYNVVILARDIKLLL